MVDADSDVRRDGHRQDAVEKILHSDFITRADYLELRNKMLRMEMLLRSTKKYTLLTLWALIIFFILARVREFFFH